VEELGPEVRRWIKREAEDAERGEETIHIGLIAKNVAGNTQGK